MSRAVAWESIRSKCQEPISALYWTVVPGTTPSRPSKSYRLVAGREFKPFGHISNSVLPEISSARALSSLTSQFTKRYFPAVKAASGLESQTQKSPGRAAITVRTRNRQGRYILTIINHWPRLFRHLGTDSSRLNTDTSQIRPLKLQVSIKRDCSCFGD